MALFDWLKTRSGGVLLHPTSLPGDTGIGTMGQWAMRWIDKLADMGAKYWQVLPTGPTGYGDSPYQSFSAFAGNPYLIDLHPLIEDGLLNNKQIAPLRELGNTKVDFAAQYHLRFQVLRAAFDKFYPQQKAYTPYGSFAQFCLKNARWLDGYALFMALKDAHKGQQFSRWEKPWKIYKQAKARKLPTELQQAVGAYKFWQYLFFGQWQQLKAYANSRGIQIIGDIPIFVCADSADLWCHPELFQTDAEGKLTFIAGVPPDYFSSTGQRWGNPLYNWDTHKSDGYSWWIERLKHAFELYDVVRIDHFRGFYDYWKIPADSVDARVGTWVDGPGIDLFQTLAKAFPDAALIAEDLGDLHDGVRDFVHQTGLPGMAILQFAFGGDAGNLYLPHNLGRNLVYYSGTHDNNTLRGWFDQMPDYVRGHFLNYFAGRTSTLEETAVRAVVSSVARLAIIPAQDLLGLGADARMNTPGVPSNNWQWRLSAEQFDAIDTGYLRNLLDVYGRI